MTDIPVIGFVIQFFQFVVDQLPAISHAAVAFSIPITLAALCGVVGERSGVVNIGIEGMMLTAAFVGWAVGAGAVAVMGHGEPTAIFGITAPLLIGLSAAVLSGLILAAMHAWISITVKADQIISGVIINIGAIGLTTYLNTILSTGSPQGAGGFQPLTIPPAIVDIPFIGWVINALFGQGPISIAAVVLVVVLTVLLFRTRWGLRTRAVGEHPRAAETVGIDVIRLRYRNVIVAGAFAALGGAYLSMEVTNSFQTEMTNGVGFIGLAAMIVGRWTPVGAFGAALLFGTAYAFKNAIAFAAPQNPMGDFLRSIPPQFWDALPYLVTIIVLAGFVGRSVAPAADGQPYEREAAA